MIYVEKLSFYKIHVSDIILVAQHILFQRPRKHDFFYLPILNFHDFFIFNYHYFLNKLHWKHYFIWNFQRKLLKNWSIFVSILRKLFSKHFSMINIFVCYYSFLHFFRFRGCFFDMFSFFKFRSKAWFF